METDLTELMTCKNCKYLVNDRACSLNNYQVKPEDTCATWTENPEKKEELKDIYLAIVEVLKEFIDTKEENYKLVALWIIGTWLHENFPTYPYLFINAMKGSGKTRLMKLIKELSWQGDMLASLSEAVLFRSIGTLCIDEFEGINNKDKNALRELLNTAYKKGGKVKRIKKIKSFAGEKMVVEEFSTFRPITMANISGMEEVLGDRCISIILEKSDNYTITRMIEDYENHPKIKIIKEKLAKNQSWCSKCSVVLSRNIYMDWNEYVKRTTLNYTTTLTTPNNTQQHLFSKIFETGINGRNLELTLPILLIANDLGIFDEIVEVVKNIVNEKKEDDILEGRDIMLIDLITKQTAATWYKIKELVTMFRQQIDFDTNEEHWLNDRWMGKALKRLSLIVTKRRLGEGIEVMLNVEKAKQKMLIFK